jgi:hypothetical protein
MTESNSSPIRPIINGREAQFNHVLKTVLDALLPLTKDERSRVLEVIKHTFNLSSELDSDSEEVKIMITKAIREQTGKIISAQINDPNSAVSRSIQKNIGVGRRQI